MAPLVGERRANPVLFDRITFPALMALSGDVGGRAIFSQYAPAYLPWHDESLLVDADRATAEAEWILEMAQLTLDTITHRRAPASS